MSGGTLDDRYLAWLHAQIDDVRDRAGSRSYRNLFKQLFSTEFIWTLPHDENRAVDGLALRDEWISQTRVEVDSRWLSLGCSFLEMLIGLARRLAFEAGRNPTYWFWHILSNLGVDASTSDEEIALCIDRVIHRLYKRDGSGGLFPLQSAPKDQRRVEIWYQLHEYLLQNQ